MVILPPSVEINAPCLCNAFSEIEKIGEKVAVT
jgi:hypothetical protein